MGGIQGAMTKFHVSVIGGHKILCPLDRGIAKLPMVPQDPMHGLQRERLAGNPTSPTHGNIKRQRMWDNFCSHSAYIKIKSRSTASARLFDTLWTDNDSSLLFAPNIEPLNAILELFKIWSVSAQLQVSKHPYIT